MPISKLPPAPHVGFFCEAWPPASRWKVPDDVPDLTGQVIIVTGGSSGIGKEICRTLVSRNAKVYLATRSEERARATIDEISKSTGKSNVHFLQLDLADLSSIKKAAEDYLSKEQELHVLINNGGVLYNDEGGLTAQQYDEQFGVNVLGHHFLTKLLLPALLRTARGEISGAPRKVRIVTVASNVHELIVPKQGIIWETLRRGDVVARKAAGRQLYGQSKLGNILIASELARRYGDQGIISISLHPGSINTELLRSTSNVSRWLVRKILLYPVAYGAVTPLYAATSEEALDMNGEYLTCWARRKISSKQARDVELAGKVWEWCEEQVVGY